MDLDAVAEALKEFGASLRRMALALGLSAVRMSSEGALELGHLAYLNRHDPRL